MVLLDEHAAERNERSPLRGQGIPPRDVVQAGGDHLHREGALRPSGHEVEEAVEALVGRALETRPARRRVVERLEAPEVNDPRRRFLPAPKVRPQRGVLTGVLRIERVARGRVSAEAGADAHGDDLRATATQLFGDPEAHAVRIQEDERGLPAARRVGCGRQRVLPHRAIEPFGRPALLGRRGLEHGLDPETLPFEGVGGQGEAPATLGCVQRRPIDLDARHPQLAQDAKRLGVARDGLRSRETETLGIIRKIAPDRGGIPSLGWSLVRGGAGPQMLDGRP